MWKLCFDEFIKEYLESNYDSWGGEGLKKLQRITSCWEITLDIYSFRLASIFFFQKQSLLMLNVTRSQ